MKQIYLINGLKRSGKDTFGKLLKEEFIKTGKTVKLLSFAAPMKEILSKVFEISIEELEEFKNENVEIYRQHPEDTKSYQITNFRKVLQNFGSEAMKPIFGDNVWVELLNKKVKTSEEDVIIITDFRFPSEYDQLDVKPYTIKIVRKSIGRSADPHISEKALDNFNFNEIIYNDKTIEDMRKYAKKLTNQRIEIE